MAPRLVQQQVMMQQQEMQEKQQRQQQTNALLSEADFKLLQERFQAKRKREAGSTPGGDA